MKKESITYEIMIDIISNIVKKHIDDENLSTKGDGKNE